MPLCNMCGFNKIAPGVDLFKYISPRMQTYWHIQPTACARRSNHQSQHTANRASHNKQTPTNHPWRLLAQPSSSSSAPPPVRWQEQIFRARKSYIYIYAEQTVKSILFSKFIPSPHCGGNNRCISFSKRINANYNMNLSKFNILR